MLICVQRSLLHMRTYEAAGRGYVRVGEHQELRVTTPSSMLR